ncbi:MAG: hypothetical protein A3J79_04475 [Elusimicrobia bacterium RIFOXYB2_FULL_62_6]|nr:MAG: hypothetical protein A3J79_04475 [Elusimicrobia bacterium RIFOXYB2_FULL_62_6]
MERPKASGPALAALYFLFAALYAGVPPSLGAVDPLDASLMNKQDSLRHELEAKIKNDILDPIFGPAKAFVFADVEMEVISRKSEQTKEGSGVIQKYKEKGAGPAGGGVPEMEFLMPGVPKPKSILGPANTRPPEAASGQQAQQGRGVQEVRYGLETEITRCQVTVIHDSTISSATLRVARTRIDEYLVPFKIKGKDMPTVLFKETKFNSYNMLDDLKRPSVYLPLLYAALVLLLLLFLFGPLWSFFRRYVNALMAKPGAEVNIDQKTEEGGGGGAGEGDQKQEGHQQIDMNFMQKSEEEEEEEDDLMKKFTPFTYLNEENLKRLIYLFLLRKEDPWVIAVVLSYLKPELSRQALSMLPVEMQSKVAMEALTVRQVSRDQIEAIDKDVRENVDFVMGGVEQLSKMLEDSDAATRKNIIEYLKTQKPEIYEKVRRSMLVFEDMVNFPDRDVQTIIRSLSNDDIAKALYKGEPAIVNKFFSNMSQGSVSAIKEIMEYSTDLTPAQADEAQMKILDKIKQLEAEGKINVRQKGSQEMYIIDGAGISSDEQRRQKFQNLAGRPGAAAPASPAAPSPENAAQAQQYMGSGAELYNQGRYEESLQHLEYAAGLDPSSAAVQQYLGSSYYALGRTEEALRAYELYAKLSNDPAVTEWLNNFKAQAGKQ